MQNIIIIVGVVTIIYLSNLHFMLNEMSNKTDELVKLNTELLEKLGKLETENGILKVENIIYMERNLEEDESLEVYPFHRITPMVLISEIICEYTGNEDVIVYINAIIYMMGLHIVWLTLTLPIIQFIYKKHEMLVTMILGFVLILGLRLKIDAIVGNK